MTYIVPTAFDDGIKGRMLLSAKDTQTGGVYSFSTAHLFAHFSTISSGSFSSPLQAVRAENWSLVSVVGDFDAISHDGAGNLTGLGSTGADHIKLNNDKKVMIRSRLSPSSHTSSSYVTYRIATHSETGAADSMLASSSSTGSLSQYAYFDWDSYNNEYADLTVGINDTTTGIYAKRDNLNNLDDDLLYAIMITPNTGTFNLCFEGVSAVGTPATDSYDTSKAYAHYIEVIQFS